MSKLPVGGPLGVWGGGTGMTLHTPEKPTTEPLLTVSLQRRARPPTAQKRNVSSFKENSHITPEGCQGLQRTRRTFSDMGASWPTMHGGRPHAPRRGP